MCLFIKSNGLVPSFTETKEDIVAYAFRIKNSDGSIQSPLNTYEWQVGVVERLNSDKEHLDDLILTRHVNNIKGRYYNNERELVDVTLESGFGDYVLTNGIFHLFKNKSDAQHLMEAIWRQNKFLIDPNGQILILCEFIIPAGTMLIEGYSMFMEEGDCEAQYESYGTTAAMLSNIIGE